MQNFIKSRLTVDNACELNCPLMKDLCSEYGINIRTTNSYRHQDNSMIETFWRNESFVRAALLGAPHIDSRCWPHAWQYVTYLHNRLPHKYHGQGTMEKSGEMQPSPLEATTGKPHLFNTKTLGFGTPVSVHIPKETRKARGGNVKLHPRGYSGHFLCLDEEQNFKGKVLRTDNGIIETTGFYKPNYDIESTGRLISNPSLRNILTSDETEAETPQTSNIPLSAITQKTRELHATQILEVSTHYDQENKETTGVVFTKILKKQKPEWITVQNFLKSNRSRISAHKTMLLSYLRNHFKYSPNNYYPIFVESDVKFKHKTHGDVLYKGLVLRTDAFSTRGFQVALFEDENSKICDFHDCVKADIVKFEVARLSAATFSSINNIGTHGSAWNSRQHNKLCVALSKTPALSKRQKTFQNDSTIPQSYPHSQTFPDKEAWDVATRQEIFGLHDTKKCLKPITKQALETDQRYKNVKVIPSVMVYKRKVNSDGTLKKCKARLCAGGHKQVAGDGTFDETFAPTAGLTSIRVCLALAVNMKLRPYQLDVEQAFLNNVLEHTMVMELPAGIDIEGCRHVELLKGVYGLKQAPALWYRHCNDAIKKASKGLLTRSRADPCLFYYFSKSCNVLLTITVDDFAVFTDNANWLAEFKDEFNKIYTITQEPDFTWFLGIRLQWNSDFTEVKLDQPNDIRKALIRFNLVTANESKTPMASDFDSSPLPADHVNPDFPYAALIGVLLWITRMSRPDIQLAVTLLASHMSKFTEYHIKAAKRVLTYLKGTADLGLHIKKMSSGFDILNCKLEIFSDSDWARDKIKRRSVTGYVGYFLGNPIAYLVRYQTTVALSSCEAEYMAMTDAAKEVLYFRNLFEDMKPDARLRFPVIMHVDNSAALAISTTLVTNKRTKHIDIRFHFLRELHDNAIVKPTKIHTDDNDADIFTKPLEEAVFVKHRIKLIYD